MSDGPVRVLVTDAQNQNALEIIRTLGRLGHFVGATSSNPAAIGFYSRHLGQGHRVHGKGGAYVSELRGIIEKHGYDVLIPVSLDSCLWASENRGLIPASCKFMLPSAEAMDIAYNKEKTMRHARSVGVPVPKTYDYSSPDSLEIWKGDITYPCVVKASKSGPEFLRYCNDYEELKSACAAMSAKSGNSPLIIQEYVRGPGHGFFALYQNGAPLATFLHERVREYPPTGGPSAVAKSYSNGDLMKLGLTLMGSLKWNGPVMVEFIKDSRTEEFKLIEINPKLWGSINLTIAAGVNIPKMIVDACAGNKVENAPTWRDVKYRWTSTNELLLLMAEPSASHLKEYLQHPGELSNMDCSDPLPVLIQICRTLGRGAALKINGSISAPSGTPKEAT
jgi:predicted ATP-grasp superfamily ATP-dependent carboligase